MKKSALYIPLTISLPGITSNSVYDDIGNQDSIGEPWIWDRIHIIKAFCNDYTHEQLQNTREKMGS